MCVADHVLLECVLSKAPMADRELQAVWNVEKLPTRPSTCAVESVIVKL